MHGYIFQLVGPAQKGGQVRSSGSHVAEEDEVHCHGSTSVPHLNESICNI